MLHRLQDGDPHIFLGTVITRSHLVSYSFYQYRHTGFASGNQIFQKWLHFLLRFLPENGLADFSLVVISPMFFHHTPNRKASFRVQKLTQKSNKKNGGYQISKGDPLQIIFEGQMGLEDDEQNMGICPKGCYPLNPSSPKNSLDFHTATQPMELGGGRQLFKKRWPCLSHISIPENASKSKDWCSTKNGSFEWTEEQKNPTILSGVFHLRLRPPYIFLWCRAGSASRAISDAFCGFLFFHRHKTPLS